MFQLEATPAILTSVTPRTEVHGDDRVFAISLGLKITGPNTLLDKLTPALRHMIYTAKPDSEPELPGVEQSTPLLRCPGVDLLTLKASLEGWTLEVDHGIDESAPITLGGCRVDKFRVAPSQGGTVDLMFRIGSNDVDAAEAGLLCSHLSQEIEITLRAPEKKADAIDGTKEAFAADHPDATDLFTAGGPEDDPSEGGDTDIEADEDAGPELEDRLANALAAADAGHQSEPVVVSMRTARGRAATKKALSDGLAAAQAAGTVQ